MRLLGFEARFRSSAGFGRNAWQPVYRRGAPPRTSPLTAGMRAACRPVGVVRIPGFDRRGSFPLLAPRRLPSQAMVATASGPAVSAQLRALSTGSQEERMPAASSSVISIRWDLGIPRLLAEWARMFSASTFQQDLISCASIICVAVPLNMAIAVASGVPPQVALVTGGIAAPVAALMGGTTLAVTGPAAAMSVLVAHAVNTHGLVALPFITMGVGIMQFICGFLNQGWIAQLVPVPVIAGFTTGVGIIISCGQLPRLLALPPAGPDANVIHILAHVASNIGLTDPLSLGVGAFAFAVVWGLPKVDKRAGGLSILAAVAAGTAASTALTASGAGSVALIGAMPPLVLSDLLKLPAAPAELLPLLPTTLIIFTLTSVESLLSCVSVDKMRSTTYQHDASQELVGQGLANIASGCMAGMPVTSVIARSTVNVQTGGQTRMPALLHGLILLGGVGAISPILATVPMPALAAVLVSAGSKMLSPPEAMHAIKVRRTDAVPYGVTVLGMLCVGLAEGVLMGMTASLVLSGANWDQPETARMAYTPAQSVRVATELFTAEQLWAMDKAALVRLLRVNYEQELQTTMSSWSAPGDLTQTCAECGGEGEVMKVMSSYDTPENMTTEVCPGCEGTGLAPATSEVQPAVYWIDGPLTFLSIFRIASLIDEVRANCGSTGRAIFDLHGCRTVDLTGAETLLNGLSDLRKEGIKVTLMNAPDKFQSALTAYAAHGEQFDVYAQAMTPGMRPGRASAVADPGKLFVQKMSDGSSPA